MPLSIFVFLVTWLNYNDTQHWILSLHYKTIHEYPVPVQLLIVPEFSVETILLGFSSDRWVPTLIVTCYSPELTGRLKIDVVNYTTTYFEAFRNNDAFAASSWQIMSTWNESRVP